MPRGSQSEHSGSAVTRAVAVQTVSSATPFEVLSLPPPFAVAAIACGLCGDPPACKTECCGGYLCSACMESRERARAEFMASTALVRPWNPSLCYFCGRGPEASVPVGGAEADGCSLNSL